MHESVCACLLELFRKGLVIDIVLPKNLILIPCCCALHRIHVLTAGQAALAGMSSSKPQSHVVNWRHAMKEDSS